MEEPSIYETSDIESDVEPQNVQEENPDIIEEQTDVTESFNRFNNEFVSGKTNFDYVSHRSLNDTGFKTYQDESVDQKLSRITRELREIEINGIDDKTETLIKLAEDLNSKRKTDVNDYRQRILKLFETMEYNIESDTEPNIESNIEKTKAPVSITSRDVIELDKKIGKLECMVGDLNSKSLESILNDMNRKVEIINNPDYKVSKIDEGIKQLLNQSETLNHLNSVDAFHTNSVGQFKSDKIQEVLSYLPNLKKYDHESGLLLSRLKDLNQVHLNIGNSVSFINNIDSQLTELSKEMSSWTDSLKTINTKLDSNIDDFESNKAKIDQSLHELELRLQK